MDLPLGGEMPIDLSSSVKETMTSTLGVAPARSLEVSNEPRLDLPLAVRPAAAAPGAGDRQLSAPEPSVQLSAISSTEAASDSSTAEPSAVQRVADSGWPTTSPSESPQTLGRANALTAPSPGVSTSRLPLVTESPARASTFSPLSASGMAPMAPLVGARPLRPSATLQRSASTDAPTITIPQMETGGALHPDPPQQGGRELPFMRAMDDTPHPDLPPQRGRELLLMSAREDAPTPTLLQRGMEDAPSLTLPQRGREEGRLPLAPSRGIAVQRASDVDQVTETEPTGTGEEAFGPIVQGAWYETRVGVSRVSAGAATLDSSTSVAAPAGPPQASETEMDELARKLYDRIRTRLKTELLVDRERAGFLTDLR
jgi:hypothetical protein